MTLLTWNFEFLEVGEKLSSFEAVDGFTMFPKECYVRLKILSTSFASTATLFNAMTQDNRCLSANPTWK